MIPIVAKENRARGPARSWQSWGMDPTSGSRSPCPARNIPAYRNPAVILIDQLKEIYIDGQLEPIEDGQLVSQGHAQGLTRLGSNGNRER